MRRFCSIFSRLLQLFPCLEFQGMVPATIAERHGEKVTPEKWKEVIDIDLNNATPSTVRSRFFP